MKRTSAILLLALQLPQLQAQTEDINALVEQGREIFQHPLGCMDCHGSDALGDFAPPIDFGPTPFEIDFQLRTTPEMEEMQDALQLTREDILAVSVYLRDLVGAPRDEIDVAALRATFDQIQDEREVQVRVTERELKIKEIEDFAGVLEGWERRAAAGSLKQPFEVEVIAEFEAGEPKFTPQPGRTYFYENTGTGGTRILETNEIINARAMQVVVGDAATREIIAWHELPPELRSNVHSTMLSPDGRYVYIIGARAATSSASGNQGGSPLMTPATLLKVDALTLQPIKQLNVGGRVHHAQVFRDRYLLIDTFYQDPGGLAVYLFDTETDEILGGVRSADLGGRPYTAWTDHEHIYLLMEPVGYGHPAAARFVSGQLTALPPSWIAKIDPDTWEVVAEFPHPGYRADWICFDGSGRYLYVPSTGTHNLSKIDKESGEIAWTSATGPGPYGCNVNADDSEVWVADKGEATGAVGRTVTVINAETGRPIETLFAAYQVDHILLAPTGTEFWLTSNGEGSIYVFDAITRKQLEILEMPNAGDPHGLVWVHYDEEGQARVIADQGGFHFGVDPRNGRPFAY